MSLAYEIVRPKGAPAGARHLARITCSACPTTADITAPTPNNPEFVAKKFRGMGWETDGFRTNTNRCPDCLKKPARKTLTQVSFIVQPKEAAPVNAMNTLREATPEERASIRRALDNHFDDAKGYYLDGYSDQKIGADLNIPWALVTKVREAAYGPIRSDPELEEIRNALGGMIKKAEEKLAELAGMRSDMIKLETRLKGVERRFASQ